MSGIGEEADDEGPTSSREFLGILGLAYFLFCTSVRRVSAYIKILRTVNRKKKIEYHYM